MFGNHGLCGLLEEGSHGKSPKCLGGNLGDFGEFCKGLSLITRIDFNLFCRFDELSIPDYSTLCRYRNWLAQDDTLSELLKLINCQLTEKGLKIEKASAAVIDATIIQTAGSKQRQAIEVDEEGQVSGQSTPSKDSDARWTKKNGLYRLGYKQHTRTDEEGYIEKLHITPANTHECNHLSPFGI